MSDAVPVSLLIARRALCPGCGAPLTLEAEAVAVTCDYCGCDSGIERRLRTVETELVEGTNPTEINRGAFIPAHVIAGEGHAETGCPGCGSPIDLKVSQDVTECPHCGSSSKVERQLNPRAADPCNDSALDAELAEFSKLDPAQAKQDILDEYRKTGEFNPYALGDRYSDHYLRVILSNHQDSVILKAAREFKPWTEFNTWRECMFTRLLLKAESSEGEIAKELYERIDRVSSAAWQSGDKRLNSIRAIVRAGARTFYRADVSEELLYVVATSQPNATLKLLLDVAEWALVNHHPKAADNALNVGARILDKRERMSHVWRSRIDPERIAEVMLYRLLYLRNELLAWALEQVPRWQLTDYRVLARFIDDCAYERPELIGAVRDAWIARQKPATTFKEYTEHLDFLATLLTPAAREYGMYLYAYLCRDDRHDDNPELVSDILTRLAAMLDDPSLRKHASWQLAQIVRRVKWQDLSGVHDFMGEHGDRLPAVVWWSYRTGHPKAKLPEEVRLSLPYEEAPVQVSPLLDELKKYKTRHERESEFLRQEDRRQTTATNAENALKVAREKIELMRKGAADWHPDERAAEFYGKAMADMREQGETGELSLASDFMYRLKHKLDMAYLEYDSCYDPRYKDYIEALEAQWETTVEFSRMRAAAQEATKYAGKSWLGRMLHKKK